MEEQEPYIKMNKHVRNDLLRERLNRSENNLSILTNQYKVTGNYEYIERIEQLKEECNVLRKALKE